MLQGRFDLNFAQEPLGADGGGELRAQNFERYVTVVMEVAGEVDTGHPPPSESALDRIAAQEGRLKAILQVAHGGRLRRYRLV